MRQVLKNKAVLGLLGSTFFQVVGISLFNMILLVLAKANSNGSFWVTLISITTILPGIFSIVLGKLAGDLTHKIQWVIGLTFSQAIMYIGLACIFLMDNRRMVIILAIILNLISDSVGTLIGLLKLPIIQNQVPSKLRQQTLGIYQSISLIMQPIGQTIGLSYIVVSGNYFVGSLINAMTFLLSALVLLWFKKDLVYKNKEKLETTKVLTDNSFKKSLSLLGKVTNLPVVNFILALLLLNVIGASVIGILNLYVLDNSKNSPFSFGTTVLMINIMFVLGNVLGSIVVNDMFNKFTFKTLLVLECSLLGIFYLMLLMNVNIMYISGTLFLITYILGKINPKVSALLMDKVDSSRLSTIFGVINSSLTIGAPIGSILLVAGYTVIGKNTILMVSIGILLVIVVLVMLRYPIKQANS